MSLEQKLQKIESLGLTRQLEDMVDKTLQENPQSASLEYTYSRAEALGKAAEILEKEYNSWVTGKNFSSAMTIFNRLVSCGFVALNVPIEEIIKALKEIPTTNILRVTEKAEGDFKDMIDKLIEKISPILKARIEYVGIKKAVYERCSKEVLARKQNLRNSLNSYDY